MAITLQLWTRESAIAEVAKNDNVDAVQHLLSLVPGDHEELVLGTRECAHPENPCYWHVGDEETGGDYCIYCDDLLFTPQ